MLRRAGGRLDTAEVLDMQVHAASLYGMPDMAVGELFSEMVPREGQLEHQSKERA